MRHYKPALSPLRRPAATLIVVLALLACACGTDVEHLDDAPAPEVPVADYTTRAHSLEALSAEVFISTEDIEGYIALGATILDTRSEEDFRAGHIPGAVHAPWAVFKADGFDGAYAEVDADRVEEIAQGLGLSHDAPVVIYGDAISTSSTRQAWQLEYYGHSEVYILDGGFDAYVAAEEPVSTDAAEVVPGDFEVRWRPNLIVKSDDIARALETEDDTVIFFDARSFPEYEGTDDRDNPIHGHIPGAIHYEWTNVFEEDGTLRDREELRGELTELGLLEEGALIVPYCQGGFRSSVAYSILRWLGVEDASNYDGSWWEYSRLNGLPVDRL